MARYTLCVFLLLTQYNKRRNGYDTEKYTLVDSGKENRNVQGARVFAFCSFKCTWQTPFLCEHTSSINKQLLIEMNEHKVLWDKIQDYEYCLPRLYVFLTVIICEQKSFCVHVL